MCTDILQIVKAVTERQRLSTVAESVLDNGDENEHTKRFLTQMLSTGHRYTYMYVARALLHVNYFL